MHGAIRTLVLLCVALAAEDATACSCARSTFAQHARTEKHVFLARAGKPVKTGDALKQTFTVLATFKGPSRSQFLFDRPATPPCASSYAEGDVAILFTSGGDLDLCHGNESIAAQLSAIPSILQATATRREAAKPAVLEAALRHVLPAYLHDRPRVSIRHAPLAGTSFDIGSSRLTYARGATRGDVAIGVAFAAGSIAFVRGTYGTEGLQFAVLLHLDGTWSVIGSSVAET